MICRKCQKDKPLEEFNDDQHLNKRKDCKLCQSKYNAAYYKKNRQKVLDYQANYRLNYNKQIMEARKKRASYLNSSILKIIHDVDTKRGAPMGRPNVGIMPVRTRIYNCYVPMNMMEPAYDKGGAYWGLSPNRLRVMYTKDLSFIKFYRENENE